MVLAPDEVGTDQACSVRRSSSGKRPRSRPASRWRASTSTVSPPGQSCRPSSRDLAVLVNEVDLPSSSSNNDASISPVNGPSGLMSAYGPSALPLMLFSTPVPPVFTQYAIQKLLLEDSGFRAPRWRVSPSLAFCQASFFQSSNQSRGLPLLQVHGLPDADTFVRLPPRGIAGRAGQIVSAVRARTDAGVAERVVEKRLQRRQGYLP